MIGSNSSSPRSAPRPTGVAAIWNPASGRAPSEDELRTALGPDVDLVATTADDPGTGQTRAAVAGGACTVVVCGGDGTIRACLDELASREVALDLVPLGTGNLLARNLGIAGGLSGASLVGRGDRRRIDIGRMNGEAFVVMAGTGLDALMVRDADKRAKSRWGILAYVATALRHLGRRPIGTTVEVDGRRWFRGPTTMVLVCNHGVVSGGLPVLPAADPSDGLLDVAVLSVPRWRDWPGLFIRLLARRLPGSYVVETTKGRDIVIHSDRPRPYELDGEARPPATTLRVGIEPRALLVHDRRSGETNGPPGT